MSGIRRVSDLGTQGAVNIYDGSIQTADIANNAITQAKMSTDVPLSGFRNLLLNGNMDIWQRGTGVRYNVGTRAYGPDRWSGSYQYQVSRTERTSVTSAPSGLWAQYACRVSSPSTAEEGGAGARLRLEQKLESANSIPLRGRTVTLSFWIRFSAASFVATSGQYQDFVYNIGAYTSTTDTATNTTAADVGVTAYITNGSLPTTWTKYTLSYTVPTNTNNVDVWFGFIDLGRHTTASFNWYEVTQIQLEVGSQPTQFEQRPVGLELSMCQRYYNVLYDVVYFNHTSGVSTTTLSTAHLPTAMRISPATTWTVNNYNINSRSVYVFDNKSYYHGGQVNSGSSTGTYVDDLLMFFDAEM